ncbi:MAG: hypothetical protein KDJ19_00775 [Hyphomicrobiaceae bacterium]|nr:hypothetical protein [Hyphomicrobiaceae bacterium]MCC0024642.1 hypothetical protein [Hyphomicrobiaceae bacterium]
MGEVKTEPVTALNIQGKEAFFEQNVAGSFRVNDPVDDGRQQFWFVCPCGCGQNAMIAVGNGYKPERKGRDTWNWNGSFEKPTLTPSVHDKGHWHGWLTDGVWRSC